jgi:hypothetical protein
MSVDEVWDWREVARRLAGREPVVGVVGKEGRAFCCLLRGNKLAFGVQGQKGIWLGILLYCMQTGRESLGTEMLMRLYPIDGLLDFFDNAENGLLRIPGFRGYVYLVYINPDSSISADKPRQSRREETTGTNVRTSYTMIQ